MPSLASLLPALETGDYVEIAILFAVVYLFLRFLRKTVAGGIFRGWGLLAWVFVLGLFFALQALHLEVLDYLLVRSLPIFLIAIVIIFQPEFRHGLARLGEMRGLRGLFSRRGEARAALIRAETLDTIFSTETILHDGAVIVRADRIAAAGCLLPLTEKPHLARQYGTRHRAAIGLSEQSDAVVVVVSEETGSVHVAERGELQRYPEPEFLAAYLNVVMAEKQGVAPVTP